MTHPELTSPPLEIQKQLPQLCTEPAADAVTLYAYLVWNFLTEPGDRMAGRFIAVYGAWRALTIADEFCRGQNPGQKLRRELAALEVSAQQLKAARDRWRVRIQELDFWAKMRDALDCAARQEIKILAPASLSWPEQLADLGDNSPTLLWYQGAAALKTPQIAIVGARCVSEYGTTVTSHFAKNAVRAGFSVVSGAALGVDAVAHRTALADDGITIAVCAGGLDRPYPRVHEDLFKEIRSAQGTIITEMPPGSAPTRWRFLQRNRIIAALSKAVLVTEASIRSGSINTAGHAAQLGRALGAVPGNITSFGSQGCHKLLLEYGAELITDTNQFMNLLGCQNDFAPQETSAPREKSLHLRILDALPLRGGLTLSKIAQKAGVSLQECETALVELELLQKVKVFEKEAESLWRLVRA